MLQVIQIGDSLIFSKEDRVFLTRINNKWTLDIRISGFGFRKEYREFDGVNGVRDELNRRAAEPSGEWVCPTFAEVKAVLESKAIPA